MKFPFLLLALVLLLPSCAALPHPRAALAPGADAVRVGNSTPGPDYEEVGIVSAVDGSGCGALGVRGNYQNAEIELKNRAVTLGAEFVKIQSVTEPFASDGCFHNEVKIYGNGYRKISKPGAAVTSPSDELNDASDVVQKLRDLKTLRDEKLITEEEFSRIKSGLLDEAF